MKVYEVPSFRGLPPATVYRFAQRAEEDVCRCGGYGSRFFGAWEGEPEEPAIFTGWRGPFCGPKCYGDWLAEVNG